VDAELDSKFQIESPSSAIPPSEKATGIVNAIPRKVEEGST